MKLKLLFLLLIIQASWLMAQQKPVIAVLNFTNASKQFYLDDLQKSFPSLLKTELSQRPSLIIVERQKIDDLLKEQNFILSDLSEDTAKQTKVGSLLGADYVITGDITEANGQLRVDVAITRISNGRVVGEKVTGPSKDQAHVMAKVLAQNIAYQLTGEGQRLQKLALKGAPASSFLITTAALGVTSGILFSQKKKLTDDYHHAQTLGQISSNYNKANGAYKAAAFFTGTAVVSLGAYIYCLIKNSRSNLEVLAENTSGDRPSFAVRPAWDGTRRNITINFSLQF